MTKCSGLKKLDCTQPCTWTVGKGCGGKNKNQSDNKYSLKKLNKTALLYFLQYYKQYYEKDMYNKIILPINTIQKMKVFIEYRCWVATQNVFALESVPDHLKSIHDEFMNVEKKMGIHHLDWNIKITRFLSEASFYYLFSIKKKE